MPLVLVRSIQPCRLYLITRSDPVDDVFEVPHHLFIPEVTRKCFCPLFQQLQDLGTKLAHLCLF